MRKKRFSVRACIFMMVAAMAFCACGSSVGTEGDGQADGDATADDGAGETQADPGEDPGPDLPPPPESAAVDILVVVDNSGSMAAEQANLRTAFPTLITALLDPPIDPETGARVHEPVRDLHIGVVSTDMGVGGYDVQTCENPHVGDDGVLQHDPHGAGCAASYPSFLSYRIGEAEDPDMELIGAMSADFGCIAELGTNGCGFEQQLEAAWKALTVHSQAGGANAGFLRPDTLLVVLVMTDEEDCSAADPTMFDIMSLPYSINLQCFYQAGKLHPVSRYANDLRSLREHPEHVIVSMIVGVPLTAACNGRGNALAGCLEEAAMQEVVRPDGEVLEYSCKYPTDCTPPDPPDTGNCTTEAYPARRFVQLAQELGESAMVHSICTDNYGPPLMSIAERIEELLQ